jgi:hypothetical protein
MTETFRLAYAQTAWTCRAQFRPRYAPSSPRSSFVDGFRASQIASTLTTYSDCKVMLIDDEGLPCSSSGKLPWREP